MSTLRCLCMMVFGFLLYPSVSGADYVRTGPVTGTVCTGFVVEFCSPIPIVATKEEERFYPMPKSFETVDEYRNQTCHVRLDDGGMWTPLDWMLKKLTKPNFYTFKDGEFEKVDPDYLSFKCFKQP